ncbi:NAD-dependent epimerase/dehydratase family protein [Paenibacillus thermoaerophilus]|uniref:NAD-dependent epimerase/dehydratase family protein n=1 Tax=Paenibacillus thermoaerophilus TaxID=1215385 RepID=A0ABW2V8J9_9BACL|nr:NAD-dependent epimerase/dehydratase family protein [Paenibacillus thermoaerophilus]TMV16148.1 NAD-dependent epimerase/dehydratase family protein [Paenibacillus thermoaerophilus]
MSVLITGVAGFLGVHLASALLKDGETVIGIDNLSTGQIRNVRKLMDFETFHFMQFDVSDRRVLEFDLLYDVREIYHLASPASPKYYQAFPFDTIRANTDGTRNMLELALRNRAKLLYASTSEAYGDPERHPQPEEYCGNVNTWGPRACYDEAKRMGEVICYEYHHRFHVDVRVARIFNTYSAGLRNDDGRVISNFVTQAIGGEDITVYGDGSQTRSFCYVDDNIRGLRLMMKSKETNGEIINIGNPKEYSILEVAQLVKKLADSPSRITFHPLPKDDPKLRRPVIDKANRLLGWKPEIELDEGLRRTIDVYRAEFAAKVATPSSLR